MVRFPGKIPTQTLWLFCEGSKTEKNYFSRICYIERINRLKIKVIDSSNTDALGVVKYAMNYKKAHPRDFEKGDLTFCVFDCDSNSNEQLEKCEAIAKKSRIQCIFSNPCFEYWILCHFVYHPSQLDSNELIEKIKVHYPKYAKNDEDIYSNTCSKLNTALDNSVRVNDSHCKKRLKLLSRESNPCTLVSEIMNQINKIKKE